MAMTAIFSNLKLRIQALIGNVFIPVCWPIIPVFVSKWPVYESLKLVRILIYIWVLRWHSWWYMAMEQLEGIFKVRFALDCRWGGGKELLGHNAYGKQKIRKAWMCGEVRMIIMRALQKKHVFVFQQVTGDKDTKVNNMESFLHRDKYILHRGWE